MNTETTQISKDEMLKNSADCTTPALQASPFPSVDKRPCYVVLDDWTKTVDGNHRPGVYYCGMTAGKKNGLMRGYVPQCTLMR
jgi:hypothetical protein